MPVKIQHESPKKQQFSRRCWKLNISEVAMLKYQLSEQEVAEINRILNERGNKSVRIKIENGQVTVFSVSEKVVIKK